MLLTTEVVVMHIVLWSALGRSFVRHPAVTQYDDAVDEIGQRPGLMEDKQDGRP